MIIIIPVRYGFDAPGLGWKTKNSRLDLPVNFAAQPKNGAFVRGISRAAPGSAPLFPLETGTVQARPVSSALLHSPYKMAETSEARLNIFTTDSNLQFDFNTGSDRAQAARGARLSLEPGRQAWPRQL